MRLLTSYTLWGILAHVKFMTRKKLLALGLLLAAVFIYVTLPVKDKVITDLKVNENEEVSFSTSTLNLKVSGVVEAADSAVVSTKTGGVVTDIFAKEGSFVTYGDTLALQATPVSDARYRLAEANQVLSEVQQSSQLDAAEYAAKKAGAVSLSAEDIAGIRAVSNDSRVSEAVGADLVALRSGVVTMLDALQFVDTNRSLFTSESLNSYRVLVNDLYGSMPDFLDGVIKKGIQPSEDLLDMLNSLSKQENISVVDVQNISTLIDLQLESLSNIYTEAEADVLDEHDVDPDGTLYKTYFTKRANILEVSSDLKSAMAGLQTTVDSAKQDLIAQGQSVTVTGLDKESAANQAKYSQAISAASAEVSVASVSVVAAEASLGRVTAPFFGVVTRMFKEVGEYSNPGEPLLKLEGVAGQEMTVTVPNNFGELLAIGQSFKVDGEVVGVVDRFSSVSTGNGLTVVLLLNKDGLNIGSSLAGELELETKGKTYALPRSYIHFSGTGPYVMDEEGKLYPVTIIYDSGSMVYVEVENVTNAPLEPAYSIDL